METQEKLFYEVDSCDGEIQLFHESEEGRKIKIPFEKTKEILTSLLGPKISVGHRRIYRGSLLNSDIRHIFESAGILEWKYSYES